MARVQKMRFSLPAWIRRRSKIQQVRRGPEVTLRGPDASGSVPQPPSLASAQERSGEGPASVQDMSEEEFKRYVAQDRAEARRYEATTKSLPKSRLLNRDDEAQVVRIDPSTGCPNVRLVRINGQLALAVPDGRLVDPHSATIHRHELFVITVRGRAYHEQANLETRTVAGTRLELLREPDNEHDPNAIAVVAPRTLKRLGYVNKLQARRLAKRLDAREQLSAISLRGSPKGKDGDPLVVLVTRQDILGRLTRTPASSEPDAHDESGAPETHRELIISDAEVRAVDRYLAGTPPVHGLAKQGPRSMEDVGHIRIGDELSVVLHGKRWVVYNLRGVPLGYLRWRIADDGKVDARTGSTITYPQSGVLHVTKLRKEDGVVVDFGGYVTPS